MLNLQVNSLRELRARHGTGDYVCGNVVTKPEGTFTLTLYPSGDKMSSSGSIGVYITCLSLSDPSIKGVAVGSTFTLQDEENRLVKYSHEETAPILLTPDPGDDTELGKGRGYCSFYKPPAELDRFMLTCDFVIRRVAYISLQPKMSSEEVPLESIITMMRQTYERARQLHVLSVDELAKFDQAELTKMQENIAIALQRKIEENHTCSVCLTRSKDHACVPCGHRYCGQCIAQVSRCPECRRDITQKLRIY